MYSNTNQSHYYVVIIVKHTLNKQTNTQTNHQTNKQTKSKQTNKQATKQTNTQTNKQTNKQTYIHAYIHTMHMHIHLGYGLIQLAGVDGAAPIPVNRLQSGLDVDALPVLLPSDL